MATRKRWRQQPPQPTITWTNEMNNRMNCDRRRRRRSPWRMKESAFPPCHHHCFNPIPHGSSFEQARRPLFFAGERETSLLSAIRILLSGLDIMCFFERTSASNADLLPCFTQWINQCLLTNSTAKSLASGRLVEYTIYNIPSLISMPSTRSAFDKYGITASIVRTKNASRHRLMPMLSTVRQRKCCLQYPSNTPKDKSLLEHFVTPSAQREEKRNRIMSCHDWWQGLSLLSTAVLFSWGFDRFEEIFPIAWRWKRLNNHSPIREDCLSCTNSADAIRCTCQVVGGYGGRGFGDKGWATHAKGAEESEGRGDHWAVG